MQHSSTPPSPPLHCGGKKNTVAFFFKIGITADSTLMKYPRLASYLRRETAKTFVPTFHKPGIGCMYFPTHLLSSDQLINCLNASCSRIFSKSASLFANSLHTLGLRLRARFKFSMANSILPCSA